MFELYKQEHKMFPFEDYELLLHYAKGCKRTLEFGPGFSTMAFVEAGVLRIHTCEYQLVFYQEARRKMAQHANVVVHHFDNTENIVVPGIAEDDMFDMAFVDAPVGQGKRRVLIPGQEKYSRLNTVLYALAHANTVLLHDCHRHGEQMTLKYVREELGKRILIHDTKKGIAVIC